MAELGLCPSCARPFTAAEVAGYGILRARSARLGGPLMILACQGCGRRLKLIPHGDGRYALPGEPPPAAVPEPQRRPPWLDEVERPAEGPTPRRARSSPRPKPAPVEIPVYDVPAEASPADAPPAGGPGSATESGPGEQAPDEEEPLTRSAALELLGVQPGAGPRELERAFRRRSKTCHPDKVAHLDLDFQRLAERKFKRLKAALDLLRS